MIKISILCLLLYCISINLGIAQIGSKRFSPQKTLQKDIRFGPKLGISLQDTFFSEIGVVVAFVGQTRGDFIKLAPMGYYGFSVSSEFNFQGDGNFIYAPKVSLEGVFIYFQGRISGTSYIDQEGKQDWRVSPEIGIGHRGLINLNFGLNIPTSKVKLDDVSLFKVGITSNLISW